MLAAASLEEGSLDEGSLEVGGSSAACASRTRAKLARITNAAILNELRMTRVLAAGYCLRSRYSWRVTITESFRCLSSISMVTT